MNLYGRTNVGIDESGGYIQGEIAIEKTKVDYFFKEYGGLN